MPEKIYDNKSILTKELELIRSVNYHRRFEMVDPFHVQEMILEGKTSHLVDYMTVIIAYPAAYKQYEYPKFIEAYKKFQMEGYKAQPQLGRQNSSYVAMVMTKPLPVPLKPLRIEAVIVQPEHEPAPVKEEPKPAVKTEPPKEEAPKEESSVQLPAAIEEFLTDPARKVNSMEILLTEEESKLLSKYKEVILATFGLTAKFTYLGKKDDKTNYRLKVTDKK